MARAIGIGHGERFFFGRYRTYVWCRESSLLDTNKRH